MANIYVDEKGNYISMIGEEKEKEMAERYLKGESAKKLAKEYGYKSEVSVLVKVHKYFPEKTPENGFCKINSQKIEKQIADEYINSNISVKELMKKYGYKTRKSITDKVKKYYPNYDIKANSKERIKDYHLDFTRIDTEFKAYFLGLMYTDGYLVDNKRFGIDLIDEDCIAFISRNTGHGYKKYYEKGNTILKRKVNKKPKYRIIFSSIENTKQLQYWGLFNNKTYTLQGCNLKEINPYFYPYILRGIIDGDGWITSLKEGLGTFGIVSASLDFINWINQLCELIGMKDMKISSLPLREGSTVSLYKIVTAKNENLRILHDVVYDESFGIRRKRNKLRKMFRDYNRSSTK